MSESAVDAPHQQTELLTAQQVQQRNEGVSDQVGLLAPLLMCNAKMPQRLGNDVNQIIGGDSLEGL